jgi:cytochrome bd-type quinol oxidase subunit 1
MGAETEMTVIDDDEEWLTVVDASSSTTRLAMEMSKAMEEGRAAVSALRAYRSRDRRAFWRTFWLGLWCGMVAAVIVSWVWDAVGPAGG